VRVATLHPWTRETSRATRIQERLRDRLVLHGGAGGVRRVAGADVSYDRGDDRLYAAVVVLELPSLQVLDVGRAVATARFPYVPGFLSFREGPGVIQAFRRLKVAPEAVIFDGQGIAHPRRFGLASHVGLWLDLPSVGCAKSRLIGEEGKTGPRRGDRAPLMLEGKRIGVTLRTREGVKPVYVSQGHRIGLHSAVRLVLRCTGRYRIPEPVRAAHAEVNRLRREGR
jgi:deoxyribonuclease V